MSAKTVQLNQLRDQLRDIFNPSAKAADPRKQGEFGPSLPGPSRASLAVNSGILFTGTSWLAGSAGGPFDGTGYLNQVGVTADLEKDDLDRFMQSKSKKGAALKTATFKEAGLDSCVRCPPRKAAAVSKRPTRPLQESAAPVGKEQSGTEVSLRSMAPSKRTLEAATPTTGTITPAAEQPEFQPPLPLGLVRQSTTGPLAGPDGPHWPEPSVEAAPEASAQDVGNEEEGEALRCSCPSDARARLELALAYFLQLQGGLPASSGSRSRAACTASTRRSRPTSRSFPRQVGAPLTKEADGPLLPRHGRALPSNGHG